MDQVYELTDEEANAAYDEWLGRADPPIPAVENLRGYYSETEELYFEAIDDNGEEHRAMTLDGARDWLATAPWGKIYLVTSALVETVRADEA